MKKKYFENFEGQKNIAHLLNYSSGKNGTYANQKLRNLNVRKNQIILLLFAVSLLIIGFLGVFP
jgi:hypothetical protein